MEMKRDSSFLTKEYVKNLLPVMLSVLGGTVNALIDSLFVSRVLGPDALSAVNMTMPVYLVLCCIGALFAGGAGVTAARLIGLDEVKQAALACHRAVRLCLAAGFAILVISIFAVRPLSELLGHGGIYSGMILPYIRVLLLFAPAFITLYIPTFFLQLDGKAVHISVMSAIIVVSDILLDYLLMCTAGLGLTGAALASGLSTLLATAYGLALLGKRPSVFRLRGDGTGEESADEDRGVGRTMAMYGKSLVSVSRIGSPIALGSLYDAFRLLILNSLILRTGGSAAMAVWAVLNMLFELSLMITSGVPQAGAPMLGIFAGARENSGIRMLVRLETICGIIMSAVFGTVILALSGPARTFYKLGTDMFLPLLCTALTVFFQLIVSVWTTQFNYSKFLWLAHLLVFFRRFLFPVLFAMLLLPHPGIYRWIFLPVSAAMIPAVCLVIVSAVRRKTKGTEHELSPVLLLDDYLERGHKVLDFSIRADADEICSASARISGFCEENEMGIRASNRIALSIEELLTVISDRNAQAAHMDIRVFALPEETGIRVRCGGMQYDPFSDRESSEDYLMGISMLRNMAQTIIYTYALGWNNLMISFERGNNKG